MEFNFIELLEKISKNTKKYWILVLSICLIILFFIWYFLPEISYDIPNVKNTDLILRLLYSCIDILISMVLIFSDNYVKKNRSKLPGVGFLINSSILNGKQFEKEMFFKMFKEETKKKFKIIIYEDVKKINEEKMDDLIEKYNLDILFVIEEVSARQNGEKVYMFRIKSAVIRFNFIPVNIDKFKRELDLEIIHSMNRFIEITEKNDYIDSCKETEALMAQILYIIVFIYLVSEHPEKALNLLDELSYKVSNSNKKNIRYIKKKIPQRYLDTYIGILQVKTNKNKYYKDGLLLQETREIIIHASKYLEDNYKKSLIQQKEYVLYKDCLLNYQALNYYDYNELDLAIDSINKISNMPDNSLTKKLNLAFLYANKGEYRKAYIIYSDVSKRKDLNEVENIMTLEEINMFINNRLDDDALNIGLKFCSAITNILFRDEKLGKKELTELCEISDEINLIFGEII